MHGLPDDSLDHQRAFYPPQVVQFHAARERMKHREMLQREAERLERAAKHHQAEAERCAMERGRALAMLAAAP